MSRQSPVTRPEESRSRHRYVPRPAMDLVDELQLRLYGQRAVAKMLSRIFVAASDAASEGQHDWADNLWDGLEVVARQLEREGEAISNEVARVAELAAAPLDDITRQDLMSIVAAEGQRKRRPRARGRS